MRRSELSVRWTARLRTKPTTRVFVRSALRQERAELSEALRQSLWKKRRREHDRRQCLFFATPESLIVRNKAKRRFAGFLLLSGAITMLDALHLDGLFFNS